MRPSFDHFKMFNTYCRGIRKVPGCFEEKSAKKHENESLFSKVGVCISRLLHPNFIRGPLLIALERLKPIAMESVKFYEVSEGKQAKKHKNGGELIKIRLQIAIFESRQIILEAGLLKEEATSSPILLKNSLRGFRNASVKFS